MPELSSPLQADVKRDGLRKKRAGHRPALRPYQGATVSLPGPALALTDAFTEAAGSSAPLMS